MSDITDAEFPLVDPCPCEEAQALRAKLQALSTPTRAQWLAALIVQWARSEYPALFPKEWRHASLVGWLMNESLLTPEQAKEVRDALGASP